MRVAVAGATGRVGRHVVAVLEERGHDAVPIARRYGVDVVTREGLAAALVDVDCIIDVATTPSADEQEATEYFVTATRNLHDGRRAGRRAADGRDLHHRHRPVRRRLQRCQARPRAGRPGRPDPDTHRASCAVPRVRRGTGWLGDAGRRRLRAENAHPDGRRTERRRGAGRRRHSRRIRARLAGTAVRRDRRATWRKTSSLLPNCSPPGAATR